MAGDGDVAREIGQLSLNGEKIMGASVAPHSNTFPSFGPNESLFFLQDDISESGR